MIQQYSLKIKFPVSRSKNYGQALELAGHFDNFQKGDINIVDISMKEVFEKWEYFNLLFWRVVDWKGMILEWEGMGFHSHSDKTRIFYALEHAKDSYMCFLEDKAREIYKVELGELKYEDLDSLVCSEDDMNTLIDRFQILKRKKEIEDDGSYNNIKVKEQPWFLQNDKKFNH